jgi:endonuclease YncB( thermonuclease family)
MSDQGSRPAADSYSVGHGQHICKRALVTSLIAVVVAVVAGAVAVPAARAQDRDCGGFTTQGEAQAYFVALGGPAHDPDRLDGDSDGIACEALPCPCASAAPVVTPTPSAPPPPVATRRSARIVRAIDGDTLRVRLSAGPEITVRLIGIDTPETKRPGVGVECGGLRASAYMRQIAFVRDRGRLVTLVGDPSQDATDRYGRSLAYVDASGKGDLGRLMVQAGWASVYIFQHPFGRLTRYQATAGQAETRRSGLWDRCGGDSHRPA